MKVTVEITHKAKKDLSSLDIDIQKRIATKLRYYVKQDDPLHYAKKLTSHEYGTYRYRVGVYRVIFDIDKQKKITILIILRIKHRKEVYK